MTHLEFCHWLDGYFTLSSKPQLTVEQLTIIHNHLKLAETVSGSASGFLLQLKQHLNHLDVTSSDDLETLIALVTKSINCNMDSLR
ncbi:hypothetical protein [Legionella shakespearei]|uniref:Uncharacterized protein n=1 Tax=Legionella shakespearei DSM 23087 TaxID=1122169 RepID=A0A0W0ZB92_9GAMM|nr:hypothetical protein [Legionella shakespearei]KTD66234.1 hypothetical protein Lsha_0128 [Legionella shakespearei DSM 23087]